MTTIAWDGKMLAADRMAVTSATKVTVRKIFDCGDWVYGGSGSLSECVLISEWLTAGAKPGERLRFDEDSSYGIAVRKWDAAAFVVTGKTPTLCEMIEQFVSAGSGREYARAAMALGRTAAQAIAFASRFDAFTGLGVDSVRVGRGRR